MTTTTDRDPAAGRGFRSHAQASRGSVALVSGLLLGLLAAGPVLYLSLSRGYTTEPGYAGTDPSVPATGMATGEIVGHPEQFLGRTVTVAGEGDRVLGLGDD